MKNDSSPATVTAQAAHREDDQQVEGSGSHLGGEIGPQKGLGLPSLPDPTGTVPVALEHASSAQRQLGFSLAH